MKVTKKRLTQIIHETIIGDYGKKNLIESRRGPTRIAGLKDLFVEFGISPKDHKLMKSMVEEWYHNEGGFYHGPHQDAQMRFEDQMGIDVFENLMARGSKLYSSAWRKWNARQFDLNKYR